MDPGSHQRFATQVEPHLADLRRYVERRAPALADEVMSEVGLVAWRRIDDLPAGHERPWLFGVARNVLLAERRKVMAREQAETAIDDAVAGPGLSGDVAPPLAEALGHLRGRDRELLLMTAWEGLSTQEAAEALGVRPVAARMALVRARRRLAGALDQLDPDWRRWAPAPSKAYPTALAPVTTEEGIACRAER